MSQAQKDRLLELLADEALLGLSEEELMELNQLKLQFPEWENDVSFELTAAAIGLTDFNAAEEMPISLRSKILEDADEFFSRATKKSPNVVKHFPVKASVSRNQAIGNLAGTPTKNSFLQWLGWGIAAAACVALAVNIWLTNSRPPTVVETVKTVEVVKTPTPELPAAQKREQLLASAKDVVQTEWKSPKDEKQILGDIVWSNEQQKGFLRFRGLPANDSNKETYQLWIVDGTQNPKTPVDGGVFDIASNGEVIIPIDAKLKIKKPKAFIVTKENPGGVVVSALTRIVAVAKI